MFAKKLLTICTLVALSLGMVTLTQARTRTLVVEDGIAGYAMNIETTPGTAYENLSFSLTKPNGLAVTMDAKADAQGKASVEISGDHTKRAGLYDVVLSNGAGDVIDETTFEIFASHVSSSRSLLTSSTTSIQANGQDTGVVSVMLKDSYGNPVRDRVIKLLASRSGVITSAVSNITDALGEATFKVSSQDFGPVVYSVIDEKTNSTLEDTVRINFYNAGSGSQSLASMGQANLFAQSGSLFDPTPNEGSSEPIENESSDSMTPSEPTEPIVFTGDDNDTLHSAASGGARTLTVTVKPTAQVSESVDVTVEVLDANGDPAVNYRGTVIFESSDSNAQLPLVEEGYQFEAEDLGRQTFSKSVSFATAGEKVIRVSDVDNPELFGENTIIITGGGGATPTGEGGITIVSPTNAQTYGVNSFALVATGPISRRVNIYMDGMQVGETVSTAEGEIEFELTRITSGKHEVELRALDTEGEVIATSDLVVFFVDLDSAQINSVTLDPSGPVRPLDFVTITVDTEPGLADVQVQIENIQRSLTESPSNPGTYSVEFRAPEDPGEYSIRVFLRDDFDNTTNMESDESLVVVMEEDSVELSDVTATPNENSIELEWGISGATDTVKEYMVEYGTELGALTERVIIPGLATQAVIEDLDPETIYYLKFIVVSNGDEALAESDIISVQTSELEVIEPEFIDITTTPQEGELVLEWEFSTPDEVEEYILSYGIKAGRYLEEITIDGSDDRFTLEDLIDGTTYYMELVAYDADGEVLARSDEFSDVAGIAGDGVVNPSGSICHQAVQNVRVEQRGVGRYLMWNPIPGVASYRVYSGSTPESVNQPVQVISGQNYYLIPEIDSKDKVTTYYGVKAFCPDTLVESLNLSNVLQVETGPALLLLVLASMLGAWMWRRRYQ